MIAAMQFFCLVKVNTKRTQCSREVYQEFCIAQELGLRVIPVGSTGYEAKIIWDEVKGKINEFYYLSKKISVLGHETNPQKLTEIILSIINQDK